MNPCICMADFSNFSANDPRSYEPDLGGGERKA